MMSREFGGSRKYLKAWVAQGALSARTLLSGESSQ